MARNPSLLPSGLYDLLPPDARKETQAIAQLLVCFESFGYAQVMPPLLEFESSLLSGRGESLSQQTFRVMDPLSQTMMAFRSDITLQVARIAHTRLAQAPRPLRLGYAGAILKIKPEKLQSERQLTQAGVEIIGADTHHADAEVMIVAAEALHTLGIRAISIDINLPGLLGELCPEVQGDAALRAQVKDAVQRKDTARIAMLPIANNTLLAALADAAGPLEKALATLQKLKRPEVPALREVAQRVKHHCPFVSLTLDPLEYHGFDYHQGISFSVFADKLRHEVGRGGRYQAQAESATGFTLYVTHLLGLLAPPQELRHILVRRDVTADAARKLRMEGWAIVYALTDNPEKEAKRLGCTHIFEKGKAEKI